jgi:hypothetical protein
MRRGRSAVELARRWHVSEATALVFLFDFRDLGLAAERGGLWSATRRAQSEYRWFAAISGEAREGRPA